MGSFRVRQLHYSSFETRQDAEARRPGTGWENCEFRSYEFVSDSDENASIEETLESRQRRTGTERPLTKQESVELEKTSQKDWEEQGHPIAGKV